MEFLYNENGQSLVEYGIILGLISIVAVVILVAFGDRIRDAFRQANDSLDE
jgi:Flp pilus assembly pilin Flp